MVELTESFVLDCEELDKDHKRLVEMVNDITDDIDMGATGNCNGKVIEFVNFAKKHFSREEKLLKKWPPRSRQTPQASPNANC